MNFNNHQKHNLCYLLRSKVSLLMANGTYFCCWRMRGGLFEELCLKNVQMQSQSMTGGGLASAIHTHIPVSLTKNKFNHLDAEDKPCYQRLS